MPEGFCSICHSILDDYEIDICEACKKNPPKTKIKIPFSMEDLQELMEGKTFDWTFDGIDVHLYNEEKE